jgi:hypothetical protein
MLCRDRRHSGSPGEPDHPRGQIPQVVCLLAWPLGPGQVTQISGSTPRQAEGGGRWRTDSPDVVIAKQLLDQARLRGFTFQRTAPGMDAPLVGHRASDDWIDFIRLEGFSDGCSAWREWTSSLTVSSDELGLRDHRVEGSAVDVLTEVLAWELSP